MKDTIKLILSLSLSGSILALFIFAMKPLIKNKLSKSIQYYLWIVVLLRLVLPFSYEGSIMNNMFYSNKAPVNISTQSTVQPLNSTSENIINSAPLQKAEGNTVKGGFDLSVYFRDIFNKYAFYLWLLGAVMALTVNLTGYARFLKHIKKTNKPALNEQERIFTALLDGRENVRLMRNPYVTTPMLIGILRPCIIIPDCSFNEKQLKNILLHELSHLKHVDIGIKWLILIATSVHWFNPLIYFIKKEVNRVCELACDEAVIKNLNAEEKQAYGDALISVVAERKYPIWVLQATMCEEKKSLKERLVAIMNHNKKSRLAIVMSAVLLAAVIMGAIALGAKVVASNEKSTAGAEVVTYNLFEISKYQTPYIGDNSKVSAMVSHLPLPDSYFKQQYISLLTDNKPYKLTVYYEAKKGAVHSGEWPMENPNNAIYSTMQKNALVLFSMINNLDGVTFAFRDSQSEGKLDALKYDTTFTFSRSSMAEKYGDISNLSTNLDLLQEIVTGKLEFTEAEVASAQAVVEEYFRAGAAKDDKAILRTLTPEHNQPNVVLYGEESRTLLSVKYTPYDSMREAYITNGGGRKNGTKIENVIVFKVSFNIKYPKGELGPFNEGDYNNWSMILVRKDKDSPWLIADQGY